MILQRLLALISACLFVQAAMAEPCPPPGQTRAGLKELRQGGFAVADDLQRNQLAIALLACTGNPDPTLRDGVAYDGLATWLRGRLLTHDTIDVLYAGLLQQPQAADDTDGFRKPFAALILSELARSDRIEPAFTAERREELVQVAGDYLRGLRDYRGFSETEGWRHGVAHGSDLVLQLVLNPGVDARQVWQLMQAVASQVAPPGPVFYIYGEPARLARAVFYAHRRDDLEAADWAAWFQGIADPGPLGAWSEAYSSQAGLAQRHNRLAFLQSLHLAASAAGDEQGAVLAALAMDTAERIRD